MLNNVKTTSQINILLYLNCYLQCKTQYLSDLSHNITMYNEISSDSGTLRLSQSSGWVFNNSNCKYKQCILKHYENSYSTKLMIVFQTLERGRRSVTEINNDF